MRKVLCPICGNVIRFEEAERSMTCPVCHSLIRIKIQRADEKMVESAEFGIPTEQLYSDDEIITAELDKSAPSLFPEDGASLKAEKRVPKTVGTRKEKTETPILVYGKETQLDKVAVKDAAADVTPEKNAPEKITERAAQTREENSQESAKDKYYAPSEIIPDEDLKWVRWEDIECESELLEDDRVTDAAAAAKGKKRFRIPSDFRLTYLPIYSFVTFISLILLLYTPFLKFDTASGNVINVSGARLIGAVVTGQSLLDGADLYLYLAGAVIAAYAVLSVFYILYSFARFGEYNRHTLNVSNLFAGGAALLTLALAVFVVLSAKEIFSGDCTMLWSSLFIVIILQAYVVVSNLDKLPKYRDEKRVLLSPKSTRKKSYALLGVSMFFVWAMLINVTISLVSNIAYNVLHDIAGEELLGKLSALSLGILGTVFNELWTGSVALESAAADYLLYSYIDFGTAAALILLIAVYARYAGKTAGIFLEEIRPKGNDNVLLENEIKEKNLARFLKKSSSLSFIAYALVLTLQLAGYVVLYRGTENALPAVFTMLSFVIAAAVRCYPYAILSREQYMKAYVEYEEMGADIPPMTKKQRNRLELIPLALVLAANAVFIGLTLA